MNRSLERAAGAPAEAQRIAPAVRPYYGAALAGFLLLGALVLAPLWPQAMTAIPGGRIAATDGWQNVWHLWWFARAVMSGRTPFFTDALFFPQGVDLALQPLNSSNGLLALPITALFGPVAGYNAALLLSLALSGLAGYALAYYVVRQRVAALVGGLLFTLAPFHLTKMWDGQLELAAVQWLAFYALFLLRAVEGGLRRDALLAGLFLAVIGYTSWYYLLYTLVYSLLFGLLWLRPALRELGGGQLMRQALLTGLAGGVLLLPLLIPALTTLADAGRRPVAAEADDVLVYSANLLDFGLPSYLHPLWGEQVFLAVTAAWHQLSGDWNVALGFVTLGLALVAAGRAWATAWRWWVLTLVLLLLALGPLLQLANWRIDVPLPFTLLQQLPGMSLARRPVLFTALATVTLTPLAALGVRALLAAVGPARRGWLLGGLLLLAAVELWPPLWPLNPARVPAYLAQLEAPRGALLDLPPPRYKRIEPQQAQLIHELPLVGGYLARTPPYPFVETVPAVRRLWAMQPEATRLLERPDDALRQLDYYGVRHVVVRWPELTANQTARLERVLAEVFAGVAPVSIDREFTAFVAPEVESLPFAYFGPDWYHEEQSGARSWRWMAEQGTIVLVNPFDTPRVVTLRLQAQSFAAPRTVALAFAGRALGEWPVAGSATPLTLRLLLPPGEQRLVLAAPVERDATGGGRHLSIVVTAANLR